MADFLNMSAHAYKYSSVTARKLGFSLSSFMESELNLSR